MDFFIELSERAWKANRDGDAAFYDSYLTDDPVAISPWGVETDRFGDIADLRGEREPVHADGPVGAPGGRL